MYTAKIENSSGDILTLTGDEAVFQVVEIDGLNPPQAQINTTTIVGMDGAAFNSSRLNTRNIVISVRINGDVEQNRLKLYSYFRTKEWCCFYFKNDTLDVSIDGYVENVECNLFENGQTAQISILCPQPYFKSVKISIADVSASRALFAFPFSIDVGEPVPISSFQNDRSTTVFNTSQAATGAIIEVDFFADCEEFEIANISSGGAISITYGFLSGDRLQISTVPGAKEILLTRNGEVINLFTALQIGSKFFSLLPGGNVINYNVDGGANNENVRVRILHYDAFRGV